MGRTRGLHGHSIKQNIGLVSILQWLSRSPHMRKVLARNRISLFLRFTFPFKKYKAGWKLWQQVHLHFPWPQKQGDRKRKAKCLSKEALPVAEKRREAKGKREKERYIHLNAEFQRIARRDMKAFLSDQCKEIEQNNRMGKTRDLFKKIRDTKGTFHAKKWYGPNRSRRYF